MRHIRKNIEIKNTPRERVFDYINTPANLLTVWPSLTEISNVERSPDGRQSYDWVYRMVGLPFKGHSATVEMDEPRLLVVRNEGGIPSTFRWTFEKVGAGTRIEVDIEYEVPAPVVGKLAEAVVARLNEHEVLTLLANLKATLEMSSSQNAGTQKQART